LRVAKLQGERVVWEPSLGKLRWRNGSEAQLFSGENPDGLRGPEHDFAWADELAKWAQPEAAWSNLQMGLRRGSRARALITTTPRPMPLLERIRDDKWTMMTTGRTDENINLDDRYVEVMRATYGGTRLGRQELDGELISDVEGSLWPRDLIDRSRMERPLRFDRIVVGVDPPAGVGGGCVRHRCCRTGRGPAVRPRRRELPGTEPRRLGPACCGGGGAVGGGHGRRRS
jgi:phage terminase large subunit-like protein